MTAKAESAIYSPPKKGLPFLLVTVAPDGVSATPVNSRVEARAILAARRLKDSAAKKLEKLVRPSQP